jgi:hypothetical protein
VCRNLAWTVLFTFDKGGEGAEDRRSVRGIEWVSEQRNVAIEGSGCAGEEEAGLIVGAGGVGRREVGGNACVENSERRAYDVAGRACFACALYGAIRRALQNLAMISWRYHFRVFVFTNFDIALM